MVQINKQVILDDFSKKDFFYKKSNLLEMLSRLYGKGNDEVINDLGNLVYKLKDQSQDEILLKTYEIIIDAVYVTKENLLNESILKLEKAKQNLLNMKIEEREEKNSENLDNLFTNI